MILTRYAPDEPQHSEAKELLNKVENGGIEAATSVLTLVEVLSTVSRAYGRFRGESISMKREDVVGAFLRRIADIRHLYFIPFGGEVSVSFEEKNVELPAILAVAIEIGAGTGVKTLDNIHLAAALITSRIYGQGIDYFVTLDEDILKHKEQIMGLAELKVATPAQIPMS